MTKDGVSDFYNEFAARQLKIGANERLISLYKRALKLGLGSDSNVLELGCGVGLFTKLLTKQIKSGSIEAVDLSDKSIQIAKSHLTNNNVNFQVGDVVRYQPQLKNIHLITLLDVIEHIPLSEHELLFQNLSTSFSEETLLLINIPNPQYIEYGHQHHPEKMQVIDQPVELLPLLQNLDKAGLEIIYFEKYGIWEEEDYHVLVIRKKRPFKLKHLSDNKDLKTKALDKMRRKVDNLKYR